MSSPAATVASIDGPLAVPARPDQPPPPSVPWLAAAVPVAGALAFWAFTGSAFALWFALLGPLIALAGVADGWRTARRARRRGSLEHAEALARLRERIGERHDAERAALAARDRDVVAHLAYPDGVWRPAADRADVLVLGTGDVPSATRVALPPDAPADDRALVREAAQLRRAPVGARIGGGVAVVGPREIVASIVRALVAQLALTHAPGALQILADDDPEHSWMRALPHSRPASRTLAVGGSGAAPAEMSIVPLAPGAAIPPRCDVVLRVHDAVHARMERAGETYELAVECLGRGQAVRLAAYLTERAGSLAADDGAPRRPLAFDGFARVRSSSRESLAVEVGESADGAFTIDLVRDGPHAVVTGTTGAGKSELLTTWIVAMCAAYPTSDVAFVLADFKGGTAFDALRGLPHVTGVVTDLDPGAAVRAIASLRAEVRHRESILAREGARDVSQSSLGRLVIVVDEFAALRNAHPEFDPLFADVAARGRALGMHLVLGTQRVGGVVREAVLSNCALRLCLRVTDAADSRAVIGVADAAEIAGGESGRGIVLVRREADARPHRVRVALTSPRALAAIERHADAAPRRPWLAPLPALVPLPVETSAEPVVGLVDDPDAQRQEMWRLGSRDRGLFVVGAPGAGLTAVLHAVAAQTPPAQRKWMSADPEELWDVLASWPEHGARSDEVVLIDDLDTIVAGMPDEYARAVGEAIERIARCAGTRRMRVVAAAHRLNGLAGRVADALPRRLVLGTASRADHVAAGGDGADYIARRPPGRGVIEGREIQVAWVEPPAERPRAAPALWGPPSGVSGFIARRDDPALRQEWERAGAQLRAVDEPGDPTASGSGERVVVWGTPEAWLGRPRLLERVRAAHPLVIDAECDREYRLLTSDRALPPFARPGRDRAWECRPGVGPRRVVLRPGTGS